MADEEERRKQEEKERKKAEVRKRLEEQAKAKKGKKGFMTPERKKKLRTLLRKKAAEELKREQERKAEERKRIIAERCGPQKPIDNANEATLQALCKEFHARISKLEDAKYDLEYEVRQKDFLVCYWVGRTLLGVRFFYVFALGVQRYSNIHSVCLPVHMSATRPNLDALCLVATLQAYCREFHQRISKLECEKYDLEYQVRQKDYQINELTIQVNDLRGKFVKPTLKKVSKFDKLAKRITKSAQDVDFRSNLKSVKSAKFTLDEDTKEAKEKPEWGKK